MRPELCHTHSGDINIWNVDCTSFSSSVNIYEACSAFQNVSGGLYLCTEVAWELIYRQSDIDFPKMCLSPIWFCLTFDAAQVFSSVHA